jgi:hypothetical protein
MNRNSVGDAVDSMFVRCIASTNSIKAFGKAASLVRVPRHRDRRFHGIVITRFTAS